MNTRRRARATGKGESDSFFLLPHGVMDSAAYLSCTKAARALLLDIGRQYKGHNNGDLAATFNMMQPRGWTSRDSLSKAIRCLLESGLIVKTRQGGINRPTLYAVTWKPIDECGGKLDCPPTRVAPGDWRERSKELARLDARQENEAPTRRAGQPDTASGPMDDIERDA